MMRLFRQFTLVAACSVLVTTLNSSFSSAAFSSVSKTASAPRISPSGLFSKAAAPAGAEEASSRRAFLSKASKLASSAALVSTVISRPSTAYAVAGSSTNKDALVTELKESKMKLDSIPDLLQQSEWEKVRQVLKTPPVNQLWNLGDNQNTLVKLAKETGDFELLEMKDELAISLQMCDQYAYDNVFVYFQPGNGKVKVKEPTDMAVKAMSQLNEALDFLGAS